MLNKKIWLMLFFIHILLAKDFNVLILSVGRFPPMQGTAVLNHITGLINLGCFVTIFTSEIAPYLNKNQDIIDFKLMDRVIVKNFPKNMHFYDVILAETGRKGNKFLSYKSDCTKLAVCFRGSDVGAAFKKNPHCYDELFAKGDLFLPVCKSFERELIEHGCPREKIKVLHSAIDCSIFNYKQREIPSNNHVKIVSVCRLIPKKGLEYAIHAVSQLVKQGFSIEYTIIGDGQLYESLNALVCDLQMQDYIYFGGRKSITEVVDSLHKNHIFLLPSVTAENGDEEGIPNAAKEAMACGLPVILTNHSGNSELIEHEKSGLLVEQKSVLALKNALQCLIENKQLWNKFGKAGRKKIEKDFEKNKLSKKLYNLLQKVVKNDAK